MSKSMVKGFMDFAREQGVVGIAVGIAIGLQATTVVGTIVDGFISPIVAIILQGTDLSSIRTTVDVGNTTTTFEWGQIITSVLVLLATAFVVYFIVDKAGLTKLDKKKD